MAVNEWVRSRSLKIWALMLGPVGDTLNVVLAMDLMTSRFGSSTVMPLCGCSWSCCGTSEKRSRVFVAPVSPSVLMVVDFVVWVGGVVIKLTLFEKTLFDRLYACGIKTISPKHHVWPPATSEGERALRIAAVNLLLPNITVHTEPLWPYPCL